MEYQYRAYILECYFLCVRSNLVIDCDTCHKTQYMKEDKSITWIDQETLGVVSFFACKGGLNHTFTLVGSPLDWDVLLPE